jgi:hypothetical protein
VLRLRERNGWRRDRIAGMGSTGGSGEQVSGVGGEHPTCVGRR